MCDVVQTLNMQEKCSIFTWSLLAKSQLASLQSVCFDLLNLAFGEGQLQSNSVIHFDQSFKFYIFDTFQLY